MMQALHEKQIDVWLLPISHWSHQELSESQITELLSEKELERFQRFRPLTKKDEFAASRLLLRKLLTTYTNSNTGGTEAIPDGMGRPFWYENNHPLDIYFSLSHTREMICCAVSTMKEIGCDVESLTRRKYEKDLTQRVFSQEELQHYKNLAEGKRTEFFYRSWTLKEAFIKAVGQGLRVPLTSLSFTHHATADCSFTVTPDNLGDKWTSHPYSFVSAIPCASYSLAVASPIHRPRICYKKPQITGDTIII